MHPSLFSPSIRKSPIFALPIYTVALGNHPTEENTMKWILAVTLAMMSLVSVAMADGPGLPPVKSADPTKPLVLLADGPGLPPPMVG
jgi:hypothetical protein